MASGSNYRFHGADEYAFYYENAHLLLVDWNRDDAKFLFLIRESLDDGTYSLSYPGERYTDTVLDAVLPVFFVQVTEEQDESAKRYVLGSVFVAGNEKYGAYYQKDGNAAQAVLFKLLGEGPDTKLEVPTDEEYETAVQAFNEHHADLFGR